MFAKTMIILGWHFILLPIGLLWSARLIGFPVDLNWTTFLGALFLLAILRSAVATHPDA